MVRKSGLFTIVLASAALSACGLYVPSKTFLTPDKPYSNGPEIGQLDEGRAEANLVGNIRCEIGNGLYNASLVRHGDNNGLPTDYVPYLTSSWGTQVTLKLTWDEMSGISPGLSFISPQSNMQSSAIGPGGSATAHATRVETVTFLFENSQLVKAVTDYLNNPKNTTKALPDCSGRETGMMIDSDLKIGEFIVDKATLASTGIATTEEPDNSPFSTFQEDLTFVGTFSGNLTPSWKLTRFSANTSGNFLSATRTTTGDVLITLGALTPDSKNPGHYLHSLAEPAASQHTAAVIGGATATQENSRTR